MLVLRVQLVSSTQQKEHLLLFLVWRYNPPRLMSTNTSRRCRSTLAARVLLTVWVPGVPPPLARISSCTNPTFVLNVGSG